jgi:hypothetical protein
VSLSRWLKEGILSWRRLCCLGPGVRGGAASRIGTMTPPRPKRRPALSRHGHSSCFPFSSLPP